jgi:hypothetical protein
MERFAYEYGVSKGYIYDMAKGRANVSLTMLEKLALSEGVFDFSYFTPAMPGLR